jgi:hypothetical protein
LLGAPRTDPSRPDLGTRLPPWVFDIEALVGPRMLDASTGEPIGDKFRQPVPRQVGFLAAPRERSPPDYRNVVSERPECVCIRGHCVVGKVTCHHLPPPQFLFHPFERTPHAVGPRPPVDQEAPAVRLAAYQDKAQESKSLRLILTPPLALVRRTASELDQLGLFRVQRQRKLREPQAHVLQKLFGLCLMLKTQHTVIGKPGDDHIAGGVALPPLLRPEIENVVQVNVSQKGRNSCPLGRPPIRCSRNRISQSWLSVPKKSRMSMSKIQFTFFRSMPTISASNASC